MRGEVAMTAWDNDRWMSLSGRPPAAALADPDGWRQMQFGDGLAIKAPAGGHGVRG
jgi:hypothetical protein